MMRFLRRRRLARVVAPPGGGSSPSSVFAIGFSPKYEGAYYTGFSTLADLGMSGIFIGGGWGAEQPSRWRSLPAGQVGQFSLVQEVRLTQAPALDGTYEVWADGLAGAALSVNATAGFATVTPTGTANRYTVAVDTAAMRAAYAADGLDRLDTALNGASISVSVNNTTGSAITPVIHMVRTGADLAGYNAAPHGGRYRIAQKYIDHYTTASGGPHRLMWANGGWSTWCETVAEIPPDSGPGRNAFGYYLTENDSNHRFIYTVNKDPARQDYVWTPEMCAEFSIRAHRPVTLNLPPMMEDATQLAYFTRYKATFPAGVIPAALDPTLTLGNEDWNDQASTNHYFDTGYGPKYRPGAANNVSTGTPNGSFTDRGPRHDNVAHGHFRLIANARAVFGAGRFKIAWEQHHAWADAPSTVRAGGFVDTGGIAQLNARLIDMPEVRSSTGPYLYLGTGYQEPLAQLRTAIFGRWYLDGNVPGGGSAITYWRDRALASVATAMAQLDAKNTVLNGLKAGHKVTEFYEGWTSHDILSPALLTGTAQYIHQALSFDGAKWVAADVTLAGTTTNNAGEDIASMWSPDDRAYIIETSLGSPTRLSTYLVKVVAGGIRLFASRSDYNSDSAFTPAAGATAFVVNRTRTESLWLFATSVINKDPANVVLNTLRTECIARGVQRVHIFGEQLELPSENWTRWGMQDARCFQIGDYVGQAPRNAGFAWAQDTP